jgi:SAM-dependent methyltransferase
MAITQMWNSEGYAKNASFVTDLGAPVMNLVAPKATGETILDSGCGAGALTKKIADLGCKVVGLDSSLDFVATRPVPLPACTRLVIVKSIVKPSLEQCNAFLAGERLPEVNFRHNDYVRVVTGPHAGVFGSLISVEQLGSDPVFVVELEVGGDAQVSQSALTLIQAEQP